MRIHQGRRRHAVIGAVVASFVATMAGPAIASTAALFPSPPYLTSIGAGPCAPGSAGCGHALVYPGGLDVDTAGNLYVADTANGQVDKFSAAGSLIWRSGQILTNPRTLGRFQQPRDVAFLDTPNFSGVNGEGLVYVADTGNNRVDVINAADGTVSTISSGWTTRFPSIIGISAGVSPSGAPVILTTDAISNVVQEYTPDGTLLATYGMKCTSTKGVCPPNGLNAPRDAATDAAGNVWVADYADNRIVELSGTSPTTALLDFGSKGTGVGQFAFPYGVTFDDAGNLYVADSDNGRIVEYGVGSGTPQLLATYGSLVSSPTPGSFFTLRRVAVTHGANPIVYGADLWGNLIQAFSEPSTTPGTGVYQSSIGGGAPAVGAFNSNYGLTVGGGTLYVADTNNQRIEAFGESSGSFLQTFGQRGFGDSNLGFNWPRGVGYDSVSNTLWVADTKNYRVTEFAASGPNAGAATGRVLGAAKGTFNWPFDVATDQDNVLVADTFNNRVQEWNPTTNQLIWSSTSEGYSLLQPKALYVSPDPTSSDGEAVYIADSGNHRIVVVDGGTGALLRTYSPILSTGIPALHLVQGVAVDPRNGNIWVADTSYNRLVEINQAGAVIAMVGKQGIAPSQFNEPAHLAIDQVGGREVLFVADTWNDRVQEFDITNF